MKNIKKLYRYLIPLTVITVMTFSSFTNAGAFFSDFMEKFIADGKVITVRIEEGIESPRIIPAADSRISRVEDNESVILEADHTYTMTLEKRKYNYYQIQVFATREKEKAGQIWKQLIDRGYPDVEIIEKDNLYKVRTGDFPDKKQAEIEASNLKEDGYTTWMVPAEKTLSTRIYIYNQKDEQIFSGEKLIFRGEARINQNLYRDKIVFSLDNLSSSKVLKIINTTPLDYVVTGIMENRLQQKGFSAGVLKAYAVILRTELLYKLYNREKEYFNLPEFKGIDCRQEIEEAVTATTGLILSDDSDPGTFFSYLDQNNFRDILVSKFKELKIIDLKEYVIEKTRVDAEIEWGLDYNEIYQLRWEGPGLITVLDLDLNKGSFAVEPVLPGNRVSRPGDLRQMVKDNNALAAVNGGYFNY
ncbi:MAG: SPOR domain-containing protein, partial [Halanaerobiales bacterium]